VNLIAPEHSRQGEPLKKAVHIGRPESILKNGPVFPAQGSPPVLRFPADDPHPRSRNKLRKAGRDKNQAPRRRRGKEPPGKVLLPVFALVLRFRLRRRKLFGYLRSLHRRASRTGNPETSKDQG
jgi:hypothetical protein